MAQKGLLDELAGRVGCIYLSELREEKNRECVKVYLLDLIDKNYSLREWNDVVSYIFHVKEKFSTEEAVLEYIIKHT